MPQKTGKNAIEHHNKQPNSVQFNIAISKVINAAKRNEIEIAAEQHKTYAIMQLRSVQQKKEHHNAITFRAAKVWTSQRNVLQCIITQKSGMKQNDSQMHLNV